MKYLITGGTGLVGQKLIYRLLGEGHSVVLLGRSKNKALELFGDAVEFHSWNPEKEVAPTRAFSGVDTVIHLAGEGIASKRWNAKQKAKIYNSRIQGTRNLVTSLRLLNGNLPKKFICASAIGYYGNRGNESLTEISSRGTGFLSDVCTDWEMEAYEASKLLQTTSVRIGIVLSEEGGALAKMLPPFRLGLGGPIGNGTQWMSWIHIDDLVSIFIHLATRESESTVVNGVSPQAVTNREFTKVLAKVLHRPAFLPVPELGLRLLLGEMSDLLTASQRIAPIDLLDQGFQFKYPALDKALSNLLEGNSVNVLETYQYIAKPRDEVFPFFADEKNLEAITPPWLNFKVLKKSTPKIVRGSLIDYQLKLRGLPIAWQSKIEEWEPDTKFIDVQTKGPYKLWHHTHEFISKGNGTLVRDKIRYQIPKVPVLNPLAEQLVRRDLKKIFEYRREKIATLFAQLKAS